MVLDSSAVVALILDEPEADAIEAVLLRTRPLRMSAVTFVEAAVVLQRGGSAAEALLDGLVETLAIEIVPVTVEHAWAARRAYARFGKGRHPARLNLADTFAYALATSLDAPLLFKGGDFAKTDVRPVPLPPAAP